MLEQQPQFDNCNLFTNLNIAIFVLFFRTSDIRNSYILLFKKHVVTTAKMATAKKTGKGQ